MYFYRNFTKELRMAYPQFDRVPNHYAGPIIQRVKDYRLKTASVRCAQRSCKSASYRS